MVVWATGESHLIHTISQVFCVYQPQEEVFTSLWNLRYERNPTWIGWPSMQMIMFLTWKLLFFLLCSALGMKALKYFSKVSTSCPGGKYLQRVPFANAARLNAAQEIKKFGQIQELHPLIQPVTGPLLLWLVVMEIFASHKNVDLLISRACWFQGQFVLRLWIDTACAMQSIIFR